MRIREIYIKRWRHFENISLSLDDEAALVCIVGANGTGKSHLLELIAACAHRLGLSQGIEIPRGDPFIDRHEFSLRFYLSDEFDEEFESAISTIEGFVDWDRTLNISSSKDDNSASTTIEGGGIIDVNQKLTFAQEVVTRLKMSKDVYFLSLDADRAYPRKSINYNEIAQAFEIDWAGAEYTRGRSYRATTTLYDEWIKYLLAQENQSGEKLMSDMRRARKLGTAPPEFIDPFESYSDALQQILPHVQFTAVNSRKRTLLFDTTGLALSFNQLSGGEREIAFLVGQIDRFGLRQGLFLLDEPELHLNADLIRSWVAYLTGTVETGQVWLATHSLEAVEAAGQHATFVLERNDSTRQVDGLARLDTRPVLSALSRAVGTPAFSISQLVFVFVEGEESVGERERFRQLVGMPQNVRFLECGSCNEVIRRVQALTALGEESSAGIRVAGVVDRDFRSDQEVQELRSQDGIYPLEVHEVENFFLHLPTLRVLLDQNGQSDIEAISLVLEASDSRSGSWIFQRALATRDARNLPKISTRAKELAKSLRWCDFVSDCKGTIEGVMDLTGFEGRDRERLRRTLEVCTAVYRRRRGQDDLWQVCEGKEVLNAVAHRIGYSGPAALERAAFRAWAEDESVLPQPIFDLREYLSQR